MNIDQQLDLNESEDFTVNSPQGKGKVNTPHTSSTNVARN